MDTLPRSPTLPWLGGVRLAVPGDTTRCGLFFSGLGLSARPWQRTVDRFAQSGASAVAVSLAGHTGCTETLRRLTIDKLLDEAERELGDCLARSGGASVALGGFSLGALVAVVLAGRHPQCVRALFLAGFCPRLKRCGHRNLVRLCRTAQRVPGAPALLRRCSVSAGRSCQAEFRTSEYDEQPHYRRLPLSALAVLGAMQELAAAELRNVHCPIHFFHGAHDERTDSSVIRALVDELETRGRCVELHLFERSPHALLLGPEAALFAAQIYENADRYWSESAQLREAVL